MALGTVWLSFDLGVSGDYESMYRWLADHDAKECGDSVAYLNFPYTKDILAELKQSLKDSIEITKKTRIYVVFRREGSRAGRFIIGSRRQAPWTGYGSATGEDSIDDG